MKKTFKAFLNDSDAYEMFITGRAGTGKTTGLAKLIQVCQDQAIDCTVCAFTHKACGILAEKLPEGTDIQTLHKYLKKRPTINTEAANADHIERSMKHGASEKVSILFIDEYSMVGERDLMDLRLEQDEHEELKIVWLGDPNQLPPVGDMQTVEPFGDYCVTLTKVYRQADSNPLMDTLDQLVNFIEGATPEPLIESPNFRRQQDIGEWYARDSNKPNFDGCLLAFTNKRVQELNAIAQGRHTPIPGDSLFCPNTRGRYTFCCWLDYTPVVDRAFGEPLQLGTKYKTLEFLLEQGYKIAKVTNEDDEELVFLCTFGHQDYNATKTELKKAAAASNKAIDAPNAAQWAKANSTTHLAKTRSKAWREFLSFNEAVVCLDFAHAMTVHKSQGSTFKTVYLDTKDLGLAANIDYTMYLKLMYVAISRASNYVITN